MFESLGMNKTKVEAFVIFIVLLTISIFAVPIFKDDMEKPMLINLETKEQVHQKMLSDVFIVAIFLSGAVPLLYLAFRTDTQPIARRRSIVEVWNDIAEKDRIKLGLPHITDKKFNEDTILYTQDDVYSILRYPSYEQGKYFYLVLDMKDDWTKRATTPIHSFALTNMGLDRAKTLLGKKGEPLERFIGQAQKVGMSPEDIRARILERQISLEEARKRMGTPEVVANED